MNPQFRRLVVCCALKGRDAGFPACNYLLEHLLETTFSMHICLLTWLLSWEGLRTDKLGHTFFVDRHGRTWRD